MAASVVFLVHVLFAAHIFSNEKIQQAMFLTLPLGMIAVSFFFILSGFILTWSARPDDSTSKFWRRRVLKVFPNHIVMWAVSLIYLWWTAAPFIPGEPTKVTAGLAVTNLLLVHTWVPDLQYTRGLNPVSWTLASEAFFYLLFPPIFALIMKIKPERLWLAVAIVVVFAWAFPLLSLSLRSPEAKPGYLSLSFVQLWLVHHFPLARLAEFVSGILLARIVSSGRFPRIGVKLSVVATVVCVAIACTLLPFQFLPVAAPLIPFVLLIGAIASVDIDGRKSFLRHPRMVFLGEISYAFYVSHFLVIWILHRLLGNGTWDAFQAIGFAILCWIASLFFAWLLYRGVESPMMRRYATRQREAATPALASYPR